MRFPRARADARRRGRRDPDVAARHPADHHRPLPAGAADAAARPRRERRRRAADAVGADHLLRLRRSSSAGRWPTASAGGRCCSAAWRCTSSPASVGALAPSIDALIAWRALQGVAMAAAVTCGRSIVRDLYEPHEGARVMSRGADRARRHRRASPAARRPARRALRLARRAARARAVRRRRAGVRRAGACAKPCRAATRDATRPRAIAAQLGAASSRNPTFRAWAALSACTYGGLFYLLAGSSFVFIDVLGARPRRLRRDPRLDLARLHRRHLLCRRLLRRHGLRGAVRRGAWFSLAGGVGMAALSLAGVHTVWAIAAAAVALCVRPRHPPAVRPGRRGRPLSRKGRHRGVAVGLRDDGAALGVGLWLGRHLDGTVYPLTLGDRRLQRRCSRWSRGRWCSGTASPRRGAARRAAGMTRGRRTR